MIGLDESKIRVLSSNPILEKEGFTISAELNLHRMLEAAPSLTSPETPDWTKFPGYNRFSTEKLLADIDIIFDSMHVNDDFPSAKEVNAMGIRWAEIGIFLVKG